MKHWLWLLIFFGISEAASLKAQTGNWAWAQSGGGRGQDQVASVATDRDGNVYLAGSYQDSAVFSGIDLPHNRGYHLFFAKYSKEGSLVWIKTTVGLSNSSQATGISVSGDNLFLTGYFLGSIAFDDTLLSTSGSNDIFIAKFDLNGNIQWARSAGSIGFDFARSVASDGRGNTYVAGSFGAQAKFGSKAITPTGLDDAFIVKYDPLGEVLWVKNIGSLRSDEAGYGITVGVSGTLAVTGSFGDTCEFGGTKLIAKGRSDIFIAKYSAAGDLLWAQQAGDTAYGQGASVVMDAAENVYITGRFYYDGPGIVPDCDGTGNIYIAKYSSGGVKQWMKCAGNGGEESGDGIAIDSNGYMYVTGGYDYTIDFGSGEIINKGLIDAFLVKFNSSGIEQWHDRAGGKGDDYTTSIAIGAGGSIYLGGAFSDTSIFGSFQLQSRHLKDAFVARINEQSNVVYTSCLKNNGISLYPNPAGDKLNINYFSDSEEKVSIELFSVLGVSVKKVVMPNSGSGMQSLSVPIGDLPKGSYFCRVNPGEKMQSGMLIIGN